jgi:ABC-type nitrate/sulfonate/bicarbonate transport system permease component
MRRGVAQAGIVVLALLAWQNLSSHGRIDDFFFGSPSGVWDILAGWWTEGTLLDDMTATLTVLVVGWTVGVVLGAAIGVLLSLSPLAHDILGPYLAFLNGTPRMVFYPFFAVWLGFTVTSKVALVVFVILFMVIVTAGAGMREVDRDIVAHVRVVGGKRMDLVRQVYVPSLTGWMLGTSRVTVAFALQATLISEFFGPPEGLGHLVMEGQASYDVNTIWAAILVTLLLALALDQALRILEWRLQRWRCA